MIQDTISLEACPALVLNADYRPLCAAPLSLWHWQDVVRAVHRDAVVVVAEYDRVIRSPGFRMALPSIVALRTYVSKHRPAAFTRFNIFAASGFRCAYCGERFASSELTFDHVLPTSRGGRTSWDNVVAACTPCNGRKRDRTPREAGMPLLRIPRQPTVAEIEAVGVLDVDPSTMRADWLSYVYWTVQLSEGAAG